MNRKKICARRARANEGPARTRSSSARTSSADGESIIRNLRPRDSLCGVQDTSVAVQAKYHAVRLRLRSNYRHLGQIARSLGHGRSFLASEYWGHGDAVHETDRARSRAHACAARILR